MKEEKPIRLSYYRAKLVSEGPFKAITVSILSCSDSNYSGAPEYGNDRKFNLRSSHRSWDVTNLKTAEVTELVKVTADLSRIPARRIPQEEGDDGQMWYKVTYQIQITYYSAYTTYELIYGGVNYGRVASEYV